MLKIEYVPKESLKTYVNNAKMHTAEQIERIKKSIDEFGFNDPIAVWKDDEIIEGHGRLMAALEMDMEEVPIIRLDELTDEQRRAYMLVHNSVAQETGFNLDLLQIELDNIDDIDMEEFGFLSNGIDLEMDEPEKEKKYGVKVKCYTEEEQTDLYEMLKEQGYECEVTG